MGTDEEADDKVAGAAKAFTKFVKNGVEPRLKAKDVVIFHKKNPQYKSLIKVANVKEFIDENCPELKITSSGKWIEYVPDKSKKVEKEKSDSKDKKDRSKESPMSSKKEQKILKAAAALTEFIKNKSDQELRSLDQFDREYPQYWEIIRNPKIRDFIQDNCPQLDWVKGPGTLIRYGGDSPQKEKSGGDLKNEKNGKVEKNGKNKNEDMTTIPEGYNKKLYPHAVKFRNFIVTQGGSLPTKAMSKFYSAHPECEATFKDHGAQFIVNEFPDFFSRKNGKGKGGALWRVKEEFMDKGSDGPAAKGKDTPKHPPCALSLDELATKLHEYLLNEAKEVRATDLSRFYKEYKGALELVNENGRILGFAEKYPEFFTITVKPGGNTTLLAITDGSRRRDVDKRLSQDKSPRKEASPPAYNSPSSKQPIFGKPPPQRGSGEHESKFGMPPDAAPSFGKPAVPKRAASPDFTKSPAAYEEKFPALTPSVKPSPNQPLQRNSLSSVSRTGQTPLAFKTQGSNQQAANTPPPLGKTGTGPGSPVRSNPPGFDFGLTPQNLRQETGSTVPPGLSPDNQQQASTPVYPGSPGVGMYPGSPHQLSPKAVLSATGLPPGLDTSLPSAKTPPPSSRPPQRPTTPSADQYRAFDSESSQSEEPVDVVYKSQLLRYCNDRENVDTAAPITELFEVQHVVKLLDIDGVTEAEDGVVSSSVRFFCNISSVQMHY